MVANQIMMINNPGNEKMVEKASEELSLSMLSSIKSETDLLSILHNLFGGIKGKMVINKTYIHSAKRVCKWSQTSQNGQFEDFLSRTVSFFDTSAIGSRPSKGKLFLILKSLNAWYIASLSIINW